MWHKDTIEWLDIELTSYCNIKCPGCLRQESHNKVEPILNKSYTKLSDLKKWITADGLPNLKYINFCGSVDEPTSHPEILEIVDYFKSIVDIVSLSSIITDMSLLLTKGSELITAIKQFPHRPL